jgi:hypothetical protein
MWRAVAAGVSVVVAAASGVVTALVTTHPSRGLWVALGVVVIVWAVLQAAVTYGERRKPQKAEAADTDAAGLRAGKYVVDVPGSQGLQVGEHNTQDNVFHAPPTPPPS